MGRTPNAAQITGEIDKLWIDLLRCRAMFPYLPERAIGWASFDTAPFYQQRGHKLTFAFDPPLTAEMREEINAIGHWINQSYVVRLYALLDYRNIVSRKWSIDRNVPGWEEIDILRRLRDVFAHKSGPYNPTNRKQRRLYKKIVKKFSLAAPAPDAACEFPIRIDEVLLPLTNACKRYVEALQKREPAKQGLPWLSLRTLPSRLRHLFPSSRGL